MILTYLRAPVLALVFCMSLFITSTSNANNANNKSAIGTNLGTVKSWSLSWTFIDIAPRLRAWTAGGPLSFDVCNTTKSDKSLCADGVGYATDSYGWPTRVNSSRDGSVKPRSVLYDGVGSNYPSGQYLVFWEGTGTVRIEGSVAPRAVLSGTGTSAEPFRGVFTVPANKKYPIQFIIDDIGSSARNTIRNIRILVPGGVRGRVNSAGQVTDLDPYAFCTDLPSRSDGVSQLKVGSQCIDFEHVAYNRFEPGADGSDSSPTEALEQGKLVFHPKLLNQLTRYRSLRYVNFQETNNSPTVSWNERPKVKDQTFTSKSGIPPEYCIALSNAVNADPWFTMPHKANDDYNRQFARLVSQQLKSGLKVYLEYSNETWNSVYSQNAWIIDQGARRGLPGDRYKRGTRYHSERTVEIGQVWRSAMGSRSTDLKLVMGSQAFNSYISDETLSWGNASSVVDYVAIAPYFGRYFGDPNNAAMVQNMSLDSAFKEINSGGVLNNAPAGGSLAHAREFMMQTGEVARKHNVTMIAYEGGQHISGYGGTQDNQRITDLFVRLNADPRMEAAYTRYLQDWKDAGGQMFVNYLHLGAWTKWGSWGVLQNQNENPDSSPKYRALVKFVDSQPCWWQNCQSFAGTQSVSDAGDESAADQPLTPAVTVAPVTPTPTPTPLPEPTPTPAPITPQEPADTGGADGGETPAQPQIPQQVQVPDTDIDDDDQSQAGDDGTPDPAIALAAPERVVAKSRGKKIRLTWQHAASAGAIYTIYRAVDEGEYRQLARTREQRFLDERVAQGKIYRYTVRATLEAKQSRLSNSVAVVLEGRRHRVARAKMSLSSRNRSFNSWSGSAQMRIVNQNGKALQNADVRVSWLKRTAAGKVSKVKTVHAETDRRGNISIITSGIKARRGEQIRLRVEKVKHGKSLFDRVASDSIGWTSID